jgi:hypothetical protein
VHPNSGSIAAGAKLMKCGKIITNPENSGEGREMYHLYLVLGIPYSNIGTRHHSEIGIAQLQSPA